MSMLEALQNAADTLNPDDGIDLAGMLIVALPAIIAAVGTLVVGVLTVHGQRKGKERWKRDRQVIDDIHKQAVNDHPESENMRDQLDRMEATQKRHDNLLAEMNRRQVTQGRDIGGLREDVGAVRDDVGGLRGELRDDRGNLRDLESRINGFIKREHPGAGPL